MREATRANTISYDAEVLPDGRLPPPKNVKLRPGRRVHVQLRLERQRKTRRTDVKASPLWKLVGYIRGEKARDVGERHNHYLYAPPCRKAGEA